MLTICKLSTLAVHTTPTLEVRVHSARGPAASCIKSNNKYPLSAQDAMLSLRPANPVIRIPQQTTEGRPSQSYLNLIRQAARQRGLPTNYIAQLDCIRVRT